MVAENERPVFDRGGAGPLSNPDNEPSGIVGGTTGNRPADDPTTGRPDLPDETADGLDSMDEEIRHQAEDRPRDTPGR